MTRKTVDPSDYIVTPDTLVSSIDLTTEEFTLRDGRRLTDDLAEQIGRDVRDEIRRRNLVPGRKSLTAAGRHSPAIRVRVPEQLREKAERRAAAEGITLSALTRQALEAYLAS